MARLSRGAGQRRSWQGHGAPLRGLLPLFSLLVIWQLVGDPDSISLPPPSTWIEALEELGSEGELWPAIRATSTTFLISLVIATVVGSVLGMAIGASRRVDRALSPTLEVLRALPPPGIVPLALLLLGTGARTAVVIVSFASIWPVLFSSVAAMRAVPRTRIEVAQTLGLSRRERVGRVFLPSLAPGIVLGVRVAAPISLIVTVLVEILASVEGVGEILLAGQRSFDSPEVFAALVVIGALGYLVSVIVAVGESVVLRSWPPEQRAGTVAM